MSILTTRINWVDVPRDPRIGAWAAFYITLNPKGTFAMTRRTYEALGSPPAFQIFFDPTNSRIGLKPSALAGRNAYPAYKRDRGSRVINAHRLMVEHGIDLKQTIQFTNPDRDQDGILILDLRSAFVNKRVQSNARRARRQHDPQQQKVIT